MSREINKLYLLWYIDLIGTALNMITRPTNTNFIHPRPSGSPINLVSAVSYVCNNTNIEKLKKERKLKIRYTSHQGNGIVSADNRDEKVLSAYDLLIIKLVTSNDHKMIHSATLWNVPKKTIHLAIGRINHTRTDLVSERTVSNVDVSIENV